MPRMLSLLLSATMPLSACAPAADGPAPVPPRAAANAPVANASAAEAPAAAAAAGASATGQAGAFISGAIREGSRPPPPLRICAHPVAGGAPTCTDSPRGATSYRIGVAPGRYYLMGWVEAGELALIAHASQIRCIRAPCPPDELIAVAVAGGEHRDGIDLAGAYVEVPAGWPQRP